MEKNLSSIYLFYILLNIYSCLILPSGNIIKSTMNAFYHTFKLGWMVVYTSIIPVLQ